MATDGTVSRRRQVSAAWLTRRLRANDHLGRGRVATLTVEPWRQKLLSDIVRLHPVYSDDARSPEGRPLPGSFVLKFTRAERASALSARRGWKENRFYALVAAAMDDPPVPRCYDAVYDQDGERAHLLLEDLSQTHDRTPHGLPPTRREAEHDVDCLAAIHGWWWNSPQLRTAVDRRDDAWYERRVASLAALHDRFHTEVGERLSRAARSALAAVVAGHPGLLRRQAAGNLTVAHGDAHAWNFMHPLDAATERARLIDWECWDIEPGTNDLASLMAVHWFPDLRLEREGPLLERYHRGLLAAGVAHYSLDACWLDYRWSVIERTLNPLYQWHRGRPVTSWWPSLARVLAAFDDLRCRELLT